MKLNIEIELTDKEIEYIKYIINEVGISYDKSYTRWKSDIICNNLKEVEERLIEKNVIRLNGYWDCFYFNELLIDKFLNDFKLIIK